MDPWQERAEKAEERAHKAECDIRELRVVTQEQATTICRVVQERDHLHKVAERRLRFFLALELFRDHASNALAGAALQHDDYQRIYTYRLALHGILDAARTELER